MNALYPQTTCFYKAIINQLPQTATEEYELLFEDGAYENGYSPPLFVAQRYVIAYKQIKKIVSSSSWHPDNDDDNDEADNDDCDEKEEYTDVTIELDEIESWSRNLT